MPVQKEGSHVQYTNNKYGCVPVKYLQNQGVSQTEMQVINIWGPLI